MIEELNRAGERLHSALSHYQSICNSIRNLIPPGSVTKDHSRDVLDRVSEEMTLFHLYEQSLKRSKLSLSCVRNTPAFAPIHKLPPETLGHIFRLVVAGEPCLEEWDDDIAFSKYPERLTHVCSNWRRVAISLSDLWVHIDLSLHHFYNKGFLPRAELYVTRSDPLSLYVHIHGSKDIETESLFDLRCPEVVADIAPRIKILDLGVEFKYADLYDYVLGRCFDRCLPGRFTKLMIRQACELQKASKFLVSEDEERLELNGSLTTTLSGVSEERLTEALLPCTILHLEGIFFPWTSVAYQGLVELSLNCPGRRVEIPQSQLISVLKSSPRLRILAFHINIRGEARFEDTLVEPVILTELESLSAGPELSISLVTFLRLIAPGTKSLSVTLHISQTYREVGVLRPGYDTHIREFFSRSKVPRLSIFGLVNSADTLRLLELAPNIRELALEKHCWRYDCRRVLPAPSQNLNLDVLYVINGSVFAQDLVELLEVVKVRKLVFWNHRFNASNLVEDIQAHKAPEDIFSESCSIINHNEGESNPIGSWSC